MQNVCVRTRARISVYSFDDIFGKKWKMKESWKTSSRAAACQRLFKSGFHSFSNCLDSIASKLYAQFETFLCDTRIPCCEEKESSARRWTSENLWVCAKTSGKLVPSRNFCFIQSRVIFVFDELSCFLEFLQILEPQWNLQNMILCSRGCPWIKVLIKLGTKARAGSHRKRGL